MSEEDKFDNAEAFDRTFLTKKYPSLALPNAKNKEEIDILDDLDLGNEPKKEEKKIESSNDKKKRDRSRSRSNSRERRHHKGRSNSRERRHRRDDSRERKSRRHRRSSRSRSHDDRSSSRR
jgi:hypothetical protein